jgi:hypothetical protein
MCIGVLAAALAVRNRRYQAWRSTRLRYTTPWLLQLAGAALIETNSQASIMVTLLALLRA